MGLLLLGFGLDLLLFSFIRVLGFGLGLVSLGFRLYFKFAFHSLRVAESVYFV